MKKLIIALLCGVVSLNAFAAGNVAKGAALVQKYNCAACHGADFTNAIDPTYPRLAGQHADYLAHALLAYKRGAGANGRNNPIMTALVQPLSNADMKDIGAYLASLPGPLSVRR